jgi:Gram-negative bacterial TonB protein C-terminal
MKLLLFTFLCLLASATTAQKKLQTTETVAIDKNEQLKKIRKELKTKKALLLTKNPVYIIDGIVHSKISTIDTAYIEKIEIVAPKLATKKYGIIGKNGVLVITKSGVTYTASQMGPKVASRMDETDYTVEKQEENNSKLNTNKIYSKTEIEPKFIDTLYKFISKNLRYPNEAQEKEQEGIVIIKFIVEIDGNLSELEVDESSPTKYISLINESIRVLKKSSGKWSPGIQNGILVRCYSKHTINFVIPKD